MKINIRHLVLLILGLFLVKVVIADPFRLKEANKKQGPSTPKIRVSQSY